MFNSTHTLVGLAIARTGEEDWVPYAGLTAVIASNFPDIDIVTAALGTASYLDHHRGVTHNFLIIPLFSLLVAAGMYYFSGKFWRLFTIALVAMATHPVLDYLNTYGYRPLSPFDDTWYYGDILFIFDPYIDAILLLGILLGAMMPNAKRVLAWVSLGLVVLYIGGRAELHSLAASQLEQYVEKIPNLGKWAVYPQMTNPFAWNGVIQTKTQMLRVKVDALSGVDAEDEIVRVNRGSASNMVNQVAKTESADALLRFARFPVVRTEGIRFGQPGFRIVFFDFSFYDAEDRTALGAEIVLDRSLQVLKENLSFVQVIPAN